MFLNVRDPSFYGKNEPDLDYPSLMGYFSIDGLEKYQENDSQKKFIILPEKLDGLHMDLNAGYENTVHKTFSKKEKIEHLLTWINNHQEQVNSLDIDFCLSRGLLSRICMTPYEKDTDWCILATKSNKITYLCDYDDTCGHSRLNYEKFTSWGHKFEQYLTSDSSNSKPDAGKPNNEREAFKLVLKSKLNHHTLLFSAEVDGKDPAHSAEQNDPAHSEEQNDPAHSEEQNNSKHSAEQNDPPHSEEQNEPAFYLELKTASEKVLQEGTRQYQTFYRSKLLRWWLQSYLAGIPKIISGFHNNGIVHSMKMYKVEDLPSMAKGLWNTASPLQFASKFLDFVNKCVKEDDPRVVYKFQLSKGKISCEELKGKKTKEKGEYQVLPDWYLNAQKLHSGVKKTRYH